MDAERYAPARVALWSSVGAAALGVVAVVLVATGGEAWTGRSWLVGATIAMVAGLGKVGMVSVGLGALVLISRRGTPRDQRAALMAVLLGALVWGAGAVVSGMGLFAPFFLGTGGGFD